jgi:hypothetical protein
LANNQIQTLKSTEFVHNPKLSQLTISNNPLDFLLSGCILNSDGSELDCKNRLGAATNINFQNLPTATIKHMDFSNNNIITINKEMWKPIENVTLERLKANQKGFAFHYRSLEKLQLQNNKITSLHTGSHVDMFKKLHDLKILYAYGNEIVEPYPTREQVLSNKMKLVESQMGFCYLGGCRYVDIGCKLDLNPPRKVLATMQTPHPFAGRMNPLNPNHVTIGPEIPKLITTAGKVSVKKCQGSTVNLGNCQVPSVMVRSLPGGFKSSLQPMST